MRKRILLVAVVLMAAFSGCAGAGSNVEETDKTENKTVEAEKLADEMSSEGLHRVELPEDNRVCYVYTDDMGNGGGTGLSCHDMNESSEVAH